MFEIETMLVDMKILCKNILAVVSGRGRVMNESICPGRAARCGFWRRLVVRSHSESREM